MRGAILELLINAVAVAVITSGLLPGIRITGSYVPTLAVVALIFALVNVLVKPILKFLTCPLVFLTLGLIIFVIDGAMLLLTAMLSDVTAQITRGRLEVDSLLWAIAGAFIMGVIEAVLGWLLDRRGEQRVNVVTVRQTIIEQRSSADQHFDSLMRADPPLPRRPSSDDPFDFYDPDTGKPKSG